MKKIVLSLFMIFSIVACNKKNVKVPKVAMQGAEEIMNNSVIWMFKDEEGKLDVNEKNRISSTHWFFNIDKELSLKQMLPETIHLIVKHAEKSPHNTKPMNNYYTYVNSKNNHLSFFQIDSIDYRLIKRTQLPKFDGDTILVNVNSSTLRIPEINDNVIIQPVFDDEMRFQEYLETKALFIKTIPKKNISKIDYIVSEN